MFGVDVNRAALDTFLRNHGREGRRPAGYLGDVRALAPEAVWDALRPFGVTGPEELECLVGGPPCEGFSRNKVYTHRADTRTDDAAGVTAVAPVEYRERKYWRSAWSGSPIDLADVAGPMTGDAAAERAEKVVRAYNPFLNDPRNYLFRAFLDLAALLRPAVVLIENVRQMLSHADGAIASEIVERLDRIGYRAEARVLNAADYGVPQLRHRAFFLALRKDVYATSGALPWPVPTHAARDLSREEQYAIDGLGSAGTHAVGATLTPAWPGDLGAYVSTAEAIADLPAARAERDGNPRRPAAEYPDVPLSAFRRFVRSAVSTPANHVYRTPSAQVIDRLRAMRPGMKAHDLPPEMRTRKYYYNAYGRLEWDRPANTITKSFLYPGSGKFGHPEEDRVISYREAARLQSFDDDFTFHATSQEGVAHMIGAAVPPLLGYALGTGIAAALDGLGGVGGRDARRGRHGRGRHAVA